MSNQETKQKIAEDIVKNTYIYFKDTDLYFRDYIYGDPHYKTLQDLLYSYVVLNDLDWDIDYRILGSIDVVRLVTHLYEVYIKADMSFANKKYRSQRHKKNYLMKALRNATFPLLKEQYNEQQLTDEDLYALNNCKKKFRYLSIYSQEGRFLEDLSYRRWKDGQNEEREVEAMRASLESIIDVLDDTEKTVVEMVMQNNSHAEIAEILRIQHDKVRKILFYAKGKLQKANMARLQQSWRN